MSTELGNLNYHTQIGIETIPIIAYNAEQFINNIITITHNMRFTENADNKPTKRRRVETSD